MKPVKSDVSFPAIEKSVLRFWKTNGIIDQGLAANEGKKPFVFYDGPPFATGLPHYGHILAGILKDIVPRYWVMKGHYVQRRWGWDCHGLPVEFEMEKELGLQGLHDVEKYGIANFNEACRGVVLRYTKEWEGIIERTGRWVDFRNQYRTMDIKFMESVWWVVKSLFDKGLVYEGHRVMPYSWRISTPLSNFEASLNYKEVQDPALTVKFKERGKDRYFLAWTTTPWTLPSNLALSVGPEIQYVEVDKCIVSAEAKEKLFPGAAVTATFTGKQLEGLQYEPLFPYFKDYEPKKAFRVLVGEHVATGEGTGIVHTAPEFGEDDFEICKRYGIAIPPGERVDAEGKFTKDIPEYAGLNVKEADKAIIKDLKARHAIVRHDTYLHNYPFCWRSDEPLIYKAISTWFVRLDPIKPALLKANQQTRWVPEHLRDGRFGNWLENARDWNISRNRFWGTPIPIWRAEDGELLCVGSIAELEKLSGKKLTDLHKHFIDDIVIKSPKTGKPMKRIPEVLDCWFESGSMPYAQAHYPFENKAEFEKGFPADFIAEGLDQTRGWFYTLSVLSAALFGKPPFKNVIVNGLVLASDGKKMSKRLKNYPDPVAVLDTYGADALRAYLMSSPASRAEELRFQEEGVKEIVRSVILPLWNAYSFFVTYALADKWKPSAQGPSTELDRWIVSRLQSLVKHVDDRMAIYHLYEVVPAVLTFIDDLTNWYIRLNRRRFWAEEKSADKDAAYATLHYTLTEFTKVLAPILPFVTDEIYRNIGPGKPESVHLCEFPRFRPEAVDEKLEADMELVRRVVYLGRTCRTRNDLKLRQPLRRVVVLSRHREYRDTIQGHAELIRHELNLKQVEFSDREDQYVDYSAKANFKALGARFGKKTKPVADKVAKLTEAQLDELESKGKLLLDGDEIVVGDVEIVRRPKTGGGAVESQGGITLWLDTAVDEGLRQEGMAREFVNRVQKLRKDIGLEVTDRIRVGFSCSPELRKVVDAHRDYIRAEVLAESLAEAKASHWTAEQDLDGHQLKILVEKI